MITLSNVSDIMQRRARFFIQKDNINKICVKLCAEDCKARIIIILNDNPDPATLTSIALRYTHLFEDVLETYTFDILGCVNHLQADNNTYVVWTESAGFIGL